MARRARSDAPYRGAGSFALRRRRSGLSSWQAGYGIPALVLNLNSHARREAQLAGRDQSLAGAHAGFDDRLLPDPAAGDDGPQLGGEVGFDDEEILALLPDLHRLC